MSSIILDTRERGKYSVCDFHRIVLPYKRNLTINPKHNIFIFNGVPTKGKEGFLALKNIGFKIVMDLDDSLNVPDSHMLKKVFDKGLRNDLRWFLERSDLITTTTPALRKELLDYNDNVHVVPNALPFDEGQFTYTSDRYSKSPMVWAGSETHREDLAMLPDFGDSITLCGYRKDKEVISSHEWAQLRTTIQPNAVYEAMRPYSSYMESYDGHQLVLAPLVDNVFNKSKSNLKILEAGAKGLPILCSPRENYNTSEFKDFIFFAETKQEWKTLTEYLIDNPDLCHEKGLLLGQYVRTHYHIDIINQKRKTLIEGIE